MQTSTFLKSAGLAVTAACLSFSTFAQKPKGPVASPPDSVTGKIGSATVKIRYSSPSVKGREIWGGLVPYDKVWRAGANEATTFTTDKDLMIEGKPLRAGRYALFAIPQKDTWTIMFNTVPDQWGAFNYDVQKDALRVVVKPETAPMQERLVYKIYKSGFSLNWEKVSVNVSAATK
ncbi:DUF2911 domain-containing protein [Chitinophagaceae bacterium MMS25-I14]